MKLFPLSICIFLMLLSFNLTFAQILKKSEQYVIKSGSPSPIKKLSTFDKFIGKKDQEFLFLHKFQKNFYLQKWSNDFKLVLSKEFKNGLNIIPIDFLLIKSDLFWVYFTSRASTTKYYLQRLDYTTFSPIEEPLLLCTIKGFNSKSTSRESYAKFQSGDYSKNCIYLDYDDERNKEATSVSIYVYDESKEALWKKEYYNLPFPKNKSILADRTLYNNGDIDLLYEISNLKTWEKQIKTRTKSAYSLLSFKNNGLDTVSYKISPAEGEFFRSVKSTYDTNGNVIFVGMYSNNKVFLDRVTVKGLFYIKIHGKSKEILTNKRFAFSKKAYDELLHSRKNKMPNGGYIPNSEIEDFKIREIKLLSNNELLTISELVNRAKAPSGGGTYHTTNSDGMVVNKQSSYNPGTNENAECQAILVAKINEIGDTVWMSCIEKRQYSQFGIGNSYFYLLKDNKIHVFFNDDIRNVNTEHPDVLKNYTLYKPAVFRVTVIDLIDGNKNDFYLENIQKGTAFTVLNSFVLNEHKQILFFKRTKTSVALQSIELK